MITRRAVVLGALLGALGARAGVPNATSGEVDDMESLGSIIDGIKSEVLKGAKVGPETFLENVAAFRAAVDWSERWIQGVLAWHASLWVVFLVFRKVYEVQVGLFFGVTVAVGLAERLNALGAAHWEKFATQNYFDDHSIFAGALFCAPMLALSLCMLLNFLHLAAHMLVDVKRREFKDHLTAKEKEKEKEGKAD